jgi:ParB family chromosome partitioning protein
MHRKALGRGLEALIPGSGSATATLDAPPGAREIPLSQIQPNPFQPRNDFSDDAINELAVSIRASGVLQPVLVRRAMDGQYQLVAGERRFRAARIAGLEAIPAVIKEVADAEMLVLALIENVQREDLNPIEEARGYQALIEQTSLTHDQLSERVGKQRTSITNTIRLLMLPGDVQEMVSRGTLTAGHARALLSLATPGDQASVARYIQIKGFSVRRTEAFVRRKLRRQHSRRPTAKLNELTQWESKLQQKFSTRVLITPGRKGGKVEFEYYGQEDLERLFESWGVL